MKRYLVFILIILILSYQHFNFLASQESLIYESDEWNKKEECEAEENESRESKENAKDNKKKAYKKAYTEGAVDIEFNKLNTNKKKVNLKLLSFNSYILSQYYEVFLSFKKDEKANLSTYIGAVRLSPLLMYYPHLNLNPAISFYLGSFSTPQAHKNLYKPFINIISPSSNRIFFPPLNALKISKKEKSLGTAFECALPFFNFYFFWKKMDEKNSFNFYASYKNERLNFLHSCINIAFVSSFLELKEEENIKGKFRSHNLDDREEYKLCEVLSIFGIDLNFSSQFFFINSSYYFNYFQKKKIDVHYMSFRGEGGITYKKSSLIFGVSYEGASYLGNASYKKLRNKKDKLSFYLQGKVKYKFFSLASVYNLLKDYKKENLEHSYGFFYAIDFYLHAKRKVIFKNELFFNNDVYKLKATLIVQTNLIFLNFVSISSFLYLQEHSINKNIIKKYKVSGSLNFPIGEIFKLNTVAGISQRNEKTAWKSLNFFVYADLYFLFIQEYTKERGSLLLKYNSEKNTLDLQMKFRVEY